MSEISESEGNVVLKTQARKKKRTGRLSEVSKKIKLSSHEMGGSCKCTRLKCFETTSEEERKMILRHFNSLSSHNDQNNYLAGLIVTHPVQKRRPRLNESSATTRDASFSYRVRIQGENSVQRDIPVCEKAFRAIHGITHSKLVYIKNSLKLYGVAPQDKRGKHSALHRKLADSTTSLIYNHISSFKGRKSHYSLHDSKKLYLPEDLNIKKMFTLFKEQHPNVHVSYETYRCMFNTKFNISFGYPRSDTCAMCDEFSAKIKSLSPDKDKEEIKKLTTLNVLHKKKAEKFYVRKRKARLAARNDKKIEAICMDFAKNISIPNLNTNDVYYKRQLSMYSFNIHVLSSNQSFFYVYHEGIAKKSPNEIASFLFHFINNYLDDDVEQLQIFCDSAGGQNKNFTIIRFIKFLTNKNIHGLKQIKITFPIRGHSYMECDKDVGLLNLKSPMETPKDFREVIKTSRAKPSPFKVIKVTQSLILNWKVLLDKEFVQKCPFKIQPLKEIIASAIDCRLICHRTTYNGAFLSDVICRPSKKDVHSTERGEFALPLQLYRGNLTFFYLFLRFILYFTSCTSSYFRNKKPTS